MNDYTGAAAGLGIGMIIFGIVLYFGTLALMLWIGYLIMRTAVKNGILRADAERAQMPGGSRQHQAPPQHPGYSNPPR
ncbi:MAG: hypothetical protein ACQEW8_00685 [Actinomycetota bacterium]